MPKKGRPRCLELIRAASGRRVTPGDTEKSCKHIATGPIIIITMVTSMMSLVTSLRGHDLWSAVSLIRPVDIHCTRDQCPELKSILRDHGIQFSVEVEDLAAIAGLNPMKPSTVNVSK